MIYFRHKIDNTNVDSSKKNTGTHQRYSAPPSSSQAKVRFRSPFPSTIPTAAVANGTNGNHSEEYESPEKV
jgi:hypothetical protein